MARQHRGTGRESRGLRGRDLSVALGRGASALYRVLAHLSPSALRRLTRAPLEEGVLLAAVMSPAMLDRFGHASPLMGAQLRGVDARRRMLEAEGGVLSPEEAGHLLGVTRQAVDKQRRAGRLLAVNVGRRWRYPAWQFANGSVVAGIPETLVALRTPACRRAAGRHCCRPAA